MSLLQCCKYKRIHFTRYVVFILVYKNGRLRYTTTFFFKTKNKKVGKNCLHFLAFFHDTEKSPNTRSKRVMKAMLAVTQKPKSKTSACTI